MARISKGTSFVLVKPPETLKMAYKAYIKLPVQDQVNIESAMEVFKEKLPQVGKQGAFELCYRLGLFLTGRGRER